MADEIVRIRLTSPDLWNDVPTSIVMKVAPEELAFLKRLEVEFVRAAKWGSPTMEVI